MVFPYSGSMKLLLATSNAGKIIEMKEALNGLPLEILSPADVGIIDAPHEEGDTFEANALQKSRFYFERAKMPVLADDSGIIVDALKKELGIHTRRWGAGPQASDTEWIEYFLDRMKKEKNKRAQFICVLAFIDEHGKEHLFEGTCDGVITESLEADYLPGLPISACFRPDGFETVYSAMNIQEKNRISHRGRAIKKYIDFLGSPIARYNI